MGAYRTITVQIPYGMYRALKARSIKRETSYASIVRKLLEGYLDSKSEAVQGNEKNTLRY